MVLSALMSLRPTNSHLPESNGDYYHQPAKQNPPPPYPLSALTVTSCLALSAVPFDFFFFFRAGWVTTCPLTYIWCGSLAYLGCIT